MYLLSAMVGVTGNAELYDVLQDLEDKWTQERKKGNYGGMLLADEMACIVKSELYHRGAMFNGYDMGRVLARSIKRGDLPG